MEQEFNFYVIFKDGTAIEGRHVGSITQFMNNVIIPLQDNVEEFNMELQGAKEEQLPLPNDAFEEIIKQHEEEKDSEIPEWVFDTCKPKFD
jgi:hypothetical protein